MAVNTSKKLRNQIIYSIFVRNYSEAGTFAAVQADLDRIKALGTDIIWLMPIYPIGKVQRKGSVGSPYAIADYRKVDPALGTQEDFVQLVEQIHARGMKCILDIVYNHTSPDSWLVAHHPEYFYRKPDGSLGNRVGDWTDVIDLDYANRDLWEYQIGTLQMWAKIVDGFRCDVAPLVPLSFWKEARARVAEVNPDCIWLSESVEPTFIRSLRGQGIAALSDSEIYQAFDMAYDYDIHHIFRDYVDGKAPLQKYVDAVNMQEVIYPDNYVKARFLENHDQDRAASFLKTDAALRNWTAFVYFQKGAALIYAGQENQNTHRPSLFEKDPICMDGKHDISPLLTRLAGIKKLPVMADSSYSLTAVPELGAVVGVHRGIHCAKQLVGVFSFEDKQGTVCVPLQDGIYQNLVNGEDVTVQNGQILLAACPVIAETEEVR